MNDIFEGIDFSAFDEVDKNHKAASTQQDVVIGQIELLLADVIEDQEQPRRHFDQNGLEDLAESIKKRGIVQPIIVRPKNTDGKYVIVMGARRYRASQLAGAKKIPAVIRIHPSDGYDQMIENIQRENLRHVDIARFIEKEIAKGGKPSTVAASLGKPRSWVSLYVGFSHMHEVVQERVEDLGIRVAYELQKAMEIDEVATLSYIECAESITMRGVVAHIKSLRQNNSDETQGIIVEDSKIEDNDVVTDPVKLQTNSDHSEFENIYTQEKNSLPIAIIVKVNERIGRLMTNQIAMQGSQFGVVSFDNGTSIEETMLADIKLVEIITLR